MKLGNAILIQDDDDDDDVDQIKHENEIYLCPNTLNEHSLV